MVQYFRNIPSLRIIIQCQIPNDPILNGHGRLKKMLVIVLLKSNIAYDSRLRIDSHV